MPHIIVRATPGAKVPIEGWFTTYITQESGDVTVVDSHYYRQQIRDGDLALVDTPPAPLDVDATDAPAMPRTKVKGVAA
jgi:hypothetical protein